MEKNTKNADSTTRAYALSGIVCQYCRRSSPWSQLIQDRFHGVPPRSHNGLLVMYTVRGKFLDGLKRLYRRKQLRCGGPLSLLTDLRQFARLLRRLHRHD